MDANMTEKLQEAQDQFNKTFVSKYGDSDKKPFDQILQDYIDPKKRIHLGEDVVAEIEKMVEKLANEFSEEKVKDAIEYMDSKMKTKKNK